MGLGSRVQGFKGGYIGVIYGITIGAIKGDTRSLDYSSCGAWDFEVYFFWVWV